MSGMAAVPEATWDAMAVPKGEKWVLKTPTEYLLTLFFNKNGRLAITIRNSRGGNTIEFVGNL